MCVLKKIKWLYVFVAAVVVVSASTGVYAKVSADRIAEEMELIRSLDWVIPLGKYETAEAVDGARDRYVVYDGEHYGMVDGKGNAILKQQYEAVSNVCSEGRILVCKNGRYGYVDQAGEIVIPLAYEFGMDFKSGYGVVMEGRCFKALDPEGELRYEAEDEDFLYMTDKGGCAAIDKTTDDGEPQFELIDLKKKRVAFSSEKGCSFRGYGEGFWCMAKYDEEGVAYYNEKFQPVFEGRHFVEGEPFSGGAAAVIEGDQLRYIDHSGKVLFKEEASAGGNFSDGLAVVLQKKQGVFLDNNGKVLFTKDHPGRMQVQIGLEEGFHDGYCAWKNGKGKWGYLDTEGNYAIQPIFDKAENVHQGEATVTYGAETGVVRIPDTQGGK